MNYQEFEALFRAAIERNGLSVPAEAQIKRFHAFTEYLLEVNAHTNLTAIRNIPDVIDKHLIDSIAIADELPQGASVLDLGCGPGFPSIPLAIARPDLRITALDSTAKKIAFVGDAAQMLGLTNIKGVSGRAEDRALAAKLGKFDVVVSRAVARLNVLSELCLPYVKIGGKLLAMKGAKAEEELAEAQTAIKTLGGAAERSIASTLYLHDGGEEARATVCVHKIKETPSLYPRVYATITKKPL